MNYTEEVQAQAMLARMRHEKVAALLNVISSAEATQEKANRASSMFTQAEAAARCAGLAWELIETALQAPAEG